MGWVFYNTCHKELRCLFDILFILYLQVVPLQWRVLFLLTTVNVLYPAAVLLYKVNIVGVLVLNGDESADFHTSLILKLKTSIYD